MNPEISVIIPTFKHGYELEKVLYSLTALQKDISADKYEIVVVNDEPEDMKVFEAAKDWFNSGYNVRYIRNPVEE